MSEARAPLAAEPAASAAGVTPGRATPDRAIWSRVRLVTAVACLSGFAGLGYEIVWTRMLAVALGHEIVAVLGVVSALFAGLALGSLMPGRHISASSRPALWYGGLELTIGLWALALIPLTPLAADLMPALVPVDAGAARQWLAAFALPFVLLLPATLAMGATLPALEAVLAPLRVAGGAVGRVYAANTLGAVAGTLAATFLMIPAVGLSATLAICAALNLACAIALGAGARRAPAGPEAPARPDVTAAPEVPPAPGARPGLVLVAPLFVTGLLGLGYEVLAIRVVSQILENTVYTFALLLSAYLAGTAAGAALWTRFGRRDAGAGATTALVTATALACLLGAAVLAGSDAILGRMKDVLPATMAGRLAAELAIGAVAFLPPTLAMGALFTRLAQQASDRAGGMGAGLAANTFGAALAPILFGPVLVPVLGARLGFVLVALGYLLVLPNLRPRTLAAGTAVLAAALVLVVSPLSLRFVWVPPGGALLFHRDGVMAAVSVVANSAGDRHLQVNNHFRMGGSASIRSDHRQAHIPLLLHPAPRTALFLGLGTGATLSAAGDHPALRADGVELVPEVVETFPLFPASAPQIGTNPDISVHVADARRFVRSAGAPYDVIVADLYHPSVDGSGALYAREHFEAIRARLAPGGVFCQWLPLHQLDLETLRLIVRTFRAVFPQADAYLAQLSVETPLIALVGRAEPRTYPAGWLAGRVQGPALATRLAAVDLADDLSLFGLYLAGPEALSAFAGDGPLNTDDRPHVAARAPQVAYAAGDQPGERLVALLRALPRRPAEVLSAPDGEAGRRLAAYWRARDAYLELGVEMLTARGPRDVARTLAPRLVELVRISPDFSPAYLPAVAMARRLAVTDPASARRILEALDSAAPGRPEARQALAALGRG